MNLAKFLQERIDQEFKNILTTSSYVSPQITSLSIETLEQVVKDMWRDFPVEMELARRRSEFINLKWNEENENLSPIRRID
jgi:hypothetical protein